MLGCLHLKRYVATATVRGDDVCKANTLKLQNQRRTYFLQTDNADAMARFETCKKPVTPLSLAMFKQMIGVVGGCIP